MKPPIELLIKINAVLDEFELVMTGHGVNLKTDEWTFKAGKMPEPKPVKPQPQSEPEYVADPRRYDPDNLDLNS